MDRELTTLDQDDLGAVVDLLDEASAFDRFPLQQVLENTLDDPGLAPGLLLGQRDGERLVAAAIGVTRGEVGHIKLFAVHPERRRQGVGSALLSELEARLAARGATSVRFFADAPHYLRPGVDFRDTAFVSFLERRGYEQRRAVCNMLADLSTARLDTAEDEARLAGLGFEIRRLTAEDAPAFEAYLLERWTPSWRTEALRSLRRNPVSTHLALREGRIVGFAECDIQWVGPKGFYADHVGARISRCFWQYERGSINRPS